MFGICDSFGLCLTFFLIIFVLSSAYYGQCSERHGVWTRACWCASVAAEWSQVFAFSLTYRHSLFRLARHIYNRLACLKAIYCEEFCSCLQLKQVKLSAIVDAVASPHASTAVAVAWWRRSSSQIRLFCLQQVRFQTKTFLKATFISLAMKIVDHHYRHLQLIRIVDISNKSLWANAFSSKQLQARTPLQHWVVLIIPSNH